MPYKYLAPKYPGDNQIVERIKKVYRNFFTEFPKDRLKSVVRSIRSRYEFLVVVGAGGSIIAPATPVTYSQFNYNSRVKCFFCDDITSQRVASIRASIDLKKSCFVFISKSGMTIEVQVLCSYWKDVLNREGIYDLSQCFLFVLGAGESDLRRIAHVFCSAVIPYDDKVSGRYSVFSVSTLLIMYIVDLDVENFLKGGQSVLNAIDMFGSNSHPMQGAFFL